MFPEDVVVDDSPVSTDMDEDDAFVPSCSHCLPVYVTPPDVTADVPRVASTVCVCDVEAAFPVLLARYLVVGVK